MENDVINVTCNLQIYQTIWMNLALLQWNGTKFLILKFVSQDVEFSEFKQCFEESRVPDRFTATVCAIAMTVATQERTADGSQPAGVVHRSPLGKC